MDDRDMMMSDPEWYRYVLMRFAVSILMCLESRPIRYSATPWGIGVHTVFAADEGCYETALLDAEGVHPVERYPDPEEAVAGHERWVELVTRDPYASVVEIGPSWLRELDRRIVLRPDEPAAGEGRA